MKKDIYMVIDIGGTKIACAFFSSKGRFLARTKINTNLSKSPSNAIERLYRETLLFLKQKKLSPKAIKKICVGCPGPFDRKSGKILDLPNLRPWKGFALKGELKKKFKVSILLENDANLAALGEATFGAGKGYENILYITFSTGIGGGFIHNNQIYHGASGDAFEIGHMILDKDGEKCGCGKYGCLEAIASGSAIEKKAKFLAQKHKNSKLYKLYKKFGEIKVEDVLECVKLKDKVSIKIWRDALGYLGIGIANLIQVVNPDIIVIGGGIAKSWNLMFAPLKKYLKKYSWERPLSSSKVVKAKLGDRSADWGGYYLCSRSRAR